MGKKNDSFGINETGHLERQEDNQNLDFRIDNDGFNRAYRMAIFSKEFKHCYVADGLTMREHQPGTTVQPTVTLNQVEAQQLFDELWRHGFRPNDGSGNSGHIGAINEHLQDMRRLVFDEDIDVNKVRRLPTLPIGRASQDKE